MKRIFKDVLSCKSLWDGVIKPDGEDIKNRTGINLPVAPIR